MSDVIQFHNLSHIFISLIGAILLLTIHFNIRKRFKLILQEEESHMRVDKGLMHLGLAMLTWVLAGLWAFLGVLYDFQDNYSYQIGVNLFSIINNAYLLFALSYFYYAPNFLNHNKRNIKLILGIIIGVTVMTMLFSYYVDDTNINGVKWIAVPDLLLSAFICYLLLVTLYKTFYNTGLKVVASISVVMVILMFVSQIPAAFPQSSNDFAYSLIRIVAKTSLISLFLLLATTWVINLANRPKANEMKIKFEDWSIIVLNIPSKNIENQRIDFASKTTQYKNLLKLAIRRKFGNGLEQSILVNASGEIKNQTYLSRIIENINQILNLQEEDQLERRDLFTFLGESKYRLRILPELIDIDDNLLKEFTQSLENKDYSSLCN